MLAYKNENTGARVIILDGDEAEQMKEMVRGAKLPLRRTFNELLKKL